MANFTPAAAKGLIQKRGVQPPQGVQPGTPQYDQWAVAWLKAAANAGDPAAVRAAGGIEGATEGGWEKPGGATLDPFGRNAAPPSEWLGKRPPTASEFRRWAVENQNEDYARYTDRVVADIAKGFDWRTGQWKPGYGPTPGMKPGNTARGGGGGNAGTLMGGKGTYGGAPGFEFPNFTPPSYEEAINDPGFRFMLEEGLGALKNQRASLGTLRTGGTGKDLVDYAQGAANQYYGDLYNRAANSYQLNRGTAEDIFAPRYGSWKTQYGGNLQKDLQREGNIFSLLSQPPPIYGGY